MPALISAIILFRHSLNKMKISLSVMLITGLLALRTVAADDLERVGIKLPGTYQVSWIGNSFSGKDAWFCRT